MARFSLPSYVSAALSADRTAQVNTICAVALYVFAETKAERSIEELGAKLFAASPHRSLKTWQNYASTCTALAANDTVTVKLQAVWSQVSDVADMAPVFVAWLTAELTKKGYHTSPEDVANFAKGRLSIKAQAKADKAAEAAKTKAAAEAAKTAAAAPAPAPAPATLLPGEQEPQAPAPMPANTGLPTETGASGYEPAIKPARVSLFHAYVEGDTMQIELGATLTRADLADIIAAAQGELDRRDPAESTLPMIDTELV